jgi:anti-sigma factor RsiW
MKTHAEHHTCVDFLERLSRYLDNELAPADRRTIEKHLRDCPCCEDVLHSLEDTIALCHEERPQLPADVRARASARVKDLIARMPPATPRRNH